MLVCAQVHCAGCVLDVRDDMLMKIYGFLTCSCGILAGEHGFPDEGDL